MLTTRQREILRLISEGYRTAWIAAALGIKPETVNAHILRIREKLNAKSNAHAVALAKDLGIL
ncbi:helix-turn-helix domain-containing protein [Hyphococcus lacteus]|uniref:Helix-turn-helix transcriptional regulator n=1 Tax=Hyphococcus lacteus TaxID=3143536 RepID=A0ABV3Z3N7_9PROT